MNDGVPGKTGVVDDDVDLSVSELGGFLDEVLVVGWVDDVACDGDGGTACFVDRIGDRLGLGWR